MGAICLTSPVLAATSETCHFVGYAVRHIADMDADNPLASLKAVSCTYRIVLRRRAGQKVLSLRTVTGRDERNTMPRSTLA